MKRFKHRLDEFINVQSNSVILALVFIFLVVLITPVESNAQGVPPRSQTLQLIQPITPPPVTPVERQIEESKKEVKKKIEVLTLQQQASVGKLPGKFRPWPKSQPQLSRDAEMGSLEAKIQKLENELTALTRRLDNLRTKRNNSPK